MVAKNEALSDLQELKYNPLFIAGIMLYWGEGDKKNKHRVRLTNTDPDMIKLFSQFLAACNVPKERIYAQAIIYPDLDHETCRLYWSNKSGIPLSNFTKCSVIQGRHKNNKLPYGICIVGVSSSYLKVKLLEWIRLLPRELMEKKYYANM